MVEDTRKVQNEKVVMLRAGSGEAVNPRRVAGAKIVMTSGVMPNTQVKTITVTPAITMNASATTTQSVEISPDTGYDGMSKVNVSTPQQHIHGLVNVNGLSNGGPVWNGDTEETYSGNMLIVTPSKNGMAYTNASNGELLLKPSSYMGNATAEDVLSGKTFTSASGIAQVGTGSGTGNLQVKTTTVTPPKNDDPQTDGTTEAAEITPDSGYSGMSKVNVSTPQLHDFQKFGVQRVIASGHNEWDQDTLVTTTEKTLEVSPTKAGMGYPTGSYLIHPSSEMGNATAADVRQGKTFTSGSGIAQTGSMTGGDDLVKTRYTVAASNWSSSANSDGYYTYSLTLNPTLSTSYAPNIYIGGSGDSVLHTAREESMFELLKYIDLTASNTLVLYSIKKPDTTFYIFVEGQAA